MKGIFDSFFYKISNLLGKNQLTRVDKHDVETEADEDLIHMSYSDYRKFIDAEEQKKTSPLQSDFYSS
jgi:hypothetical protein